MNTSSQEFAAVVVTALAAVAGWAYLISELAYKLAYPTVI